MRELSNQNAILEGILTEEQKRVDSLQMSLAKAKQAEKQVVLSINDLSELQMDSKRYRDQFAMETATMRQVLGKFEQFIQQLDSQRKQNENNFSLRKFLRRIHRCH